MGKHAFFALVFVFVSAYATSQRVLNKDLDKLGVLTGVVSDANSNRKLAGATITVQGTNKSTQADNDGKFTFSLLHADTITITVSYVGFETKQIAGVIIKAGDVTNLSITLDAAKSNLKNVIVKTEARRENIAAVLNTRRNAAVVSDVISADMIKRSPDRSTSDVLKRVSGTTIQDNKFVIVRGMNDRYNEAMLNGALMPSSEPDRKTFAFDIFPSDLVDNITIIKSATPDLPGSFSGGLIQINTKDVPDKKFWGIKAGLGLNSLATGRELYTYKGSDKDWIGVDDHVRTFPRYFPTTEKYDKIVHPDFPQDPGLPPSSLEERRYYTQVNQIINSHRLRASTLSQLFDNNWAYFKRSIPANTAFQTSGGFSIKLNPKKDYPVLASVMGATYSSTYKFNESHKYDYTTSTLDSNNRFIENYGYTDSAITRTVLASVLVNTTFKLNPSNKVFFNNIYSVNSSDKTIIRSGPIDYQSIYDSRASSFYFTSNLIYNAQLGGDHSITVSKTKWRVKWLGYLTTLYRNTPDYRRNSYFQNDPSSPFVSEVTSATSVSTGSGVHYFSKLNDNASGLTLDLSAPFKWLGNTQTFKFGGSIYHDSRTFDSRFLSAGISNSDSFNHSLLTYGQSTIFNQQNFDWKKGFVLQEDSRRLYYVYDGSINTTAAYVMLDNRLTKQLRLTWGVRFEKYHSILNTVKPASYEPLRVDTTYNDFLPSLNAVYSVLPKANLRFSFSKTLARPIYRELANILFYDFEENVTIAGNPYLTETYINNYDLRWEHYFPQAQFYSASIFYKSFKNAIEQYLPFPGSDSRTIGFQNVKNAYNVGLELEGRKNFDFIDKSLENLVAYVNIAIIHSEVKQQVDTSLKKRPLQGQSPYIFNASLLYNDPKTNLAFSLLYNVIGPRIYVTGDYIPGTTHGDRNIWEKPHAALDFKIQKSVLKDRGLIELTFSDLLHMNDYKYWNVSNDNAAKNYDRAKDYVTERKNYGFNVSLSASYKIY